MTSLSQIPQEIFDLIAASLSPNSTKKLADALLCSESQENILWRAIFKSDGWIDKASELGACPVLVGPKLHEIGRPSYKGSRRHHILLLTNDYAGDLQYSSDLRFESLREGHCYDPAKFRIILPETTFVNPNKREMKIPEIAIYVQDAIWPQETLNLSRRAIRRLFEKSAVRTQYSFASQKKDLHCTKPSHIRHGREYFKIGAASPDMWHAPRL
ncbi:hypothetical protein ASPFODRAFT_457240 [Aspergillus luchuensis CBS 106.47]|uniref:Uncharacterized protein n=1 Tax=Aspergillus luchuensis (strain CBS 106.47) TaxID=1137211 RepID=A0A1M3SYE0_ASPLC|nr:hypothetical protein ASPFODRAFT_669691 [Aspergillus luchuensis CBS 106.47]OJZ80390.1 hypothetical protein ASPFODRAFT_457240 [Aspergillus luchuensis CBS 106.47]